MTDFREWADRARKAQEAVNELGAGPPASRLADWDREMIDQARRVGAVIRRRPGDLDRLAGTLLAELADRLVAAQDIDEALAGVERALELGETAWALEHVRLTRGRLALDEGGHAAAQDTEGNHG